MPKKNTTKAAAAATNPELDESELNYPSTDGYEDKPQHKHGDPHPRNKREVGDSAAQLSAAQLAAIHGEDVLKANEAKAREIRKAKG